MDLVNESVTFLMVSLKDGFVWNDIVQGFFHCDLVSSHVLKDCFLFPSAIGDVVILQLFTLLKVPITSCFK
jgi:hypothetical protein